MASAVSSKASGIAECAMKIQKGFVYILYSLKDHRTYTGSTDNIPRRLKQHQDGLVQSTKNRLPLELLYSEESKSLKDARKREKYLKSASGREKLKSLLKGIL